ncbi:hypothetical protein OIU76_009398 [Salix suchowensis]|uniref:5'-deoxynucleotidase n=1 Tax=Salix suchowensis TaxID=1278906 RepID=A0ABQ9BF15_9ROSI|nr:hypothetical protein OIU76_009398 [Salix suchowensis]KAJ6382172.1 hypothetical protein OIU77_030762 [Salix suchowensis]
MGSRSRNLLCKSSSSTLLFLSPSSTSAQLRFNSFTPSKRRSMATQPSSSASSLTANDTASPSPSPSPSSAIDFLSLCHRLKTTKRAGWVKRDIKGPESISDHMYRMGLMALIAPDIPGIDRDKCIKMAIVHDIAEAIVGDITPSDGVPKAEKSRKEREALEHMCKLLGAESRAKEMSELWNEYEENSTPEAKIVKDFDKLYGNGLLLRSKQGRDLEEFFQSTAGKLQTEMGKAWALEIASRRRKEG